MDGGWTVAGPPLQLINLPIQVGFEMVQPSNIRRSLIEFAALKVYEFDLPKSAESVVTSYF
jgi:hypothetical protein